MSPVRQPADHFREAIDDLLGRCAAQGTPVQLYIVGGAALAFGHQGREMITDVDAVIRCPEDITDLIAEVGADHDLESSWLNNDVKAFVSPVVDDPEPIEIATVGESHVMAASLRVFAAMKIRAGRPGIDRPDLAFLLEKLDVKTRPRPSACSSGISPRTYFVTRH